MKLELLSWALMTLVHDSNIKNKSVVSLILSEVKGVIGAVYFWHSNLLKNFKRIIIIA